jgi:hypothetical protein
VGSDTLSHLDGNGVTLWSKTFQLLGSANIGLPEPYLAVAPDGSVTFAAMFDVPVDVGVTLTPVAEDLMVVTYAADGSLKWAKSFGDVGGVVSVNALAVDATDRVVLAGNSVLGAGADLGAGPVSGNFLVALEADGSLAWTQPAAGGFVPEMLTGFAIDPAGGFVGVGAVTVSDCDVRAFVGRYDDGGALLSSRSFSRMGYGNSAALDSQGAIYVTLNTYGGLDLGAGAREAGSLLAKLDAQYDLVWERQLAYGDGRATEGSARATRVNADPASAPGGMAASAKASARA